jgi:hypothetical protein
LTWSNVRWAMLSILHPKSHTRSTTMMPDRSWMDPRNSASQEVQQTTTFLASQSNKHHTSPQTPLLGTSDTKSFRNMHQFVLQNRASTAEQTLSETDEFFLNVFTTKRRADFSTDPLFTHWNNPQDTGDCYGTGNGYHIPVDPTSPHMLQKVQYVCWQHGCKGRKFTTLSNYRRHCKERSWGYARPQCPLCGQQFLREAARNAHYNQQRCRVAGINANGKHAWTSIDLDNTLWKLWPY